MTDLRTISIVTLIWIMSPFVYTSEKLGLFSKNEIGLNNNRFLTTKSAKKNDI